MISVKSFCFNPFQENTYILFNEQNECIIIDPGMNGAYEEMALDTFITDNFLTPIHLINTHCHIDHILGLRYCADKYKLPFQCHHNEIPVLANGRASAAIYGVHYTEAPAPDHFIHEGDIIHLGNEKLIALFTPGHSPGSLSFYSEQSGFVIAGDTLFNQSIGRSDLPGGDYNTLINAIKTELLTLPESTVVYSGHGPKTTIGNEKKFNPYLVER
ncbi:MAG: MBL fold metallo-hydrolase [Bacteroidota bacterium]